MDFPKPQNNPFIPYEKKKFYQDNVANWRGGAYVGNLSGLYGTTLSPQNSEINTQPWYNSTRRWAQLAFVESDPRNYDPDFWLSYFKRIHADGVLLSAGGVVAFYPTDIPLHHRSNWLGDEDTLGYLMKGCRKLGMTVILRTDPHAARQEVVETHPDWIAVTVDGQMENMPKNCGPPWV